jgi:hypothetical protein
MNCEKRAHFIHNRFQPPVPAKENKQKTKLSHFFMLSCERHRKEQNNLHYLHFYYKITFTRTRILQTLPVIFPTFGQLEADHLFLRSDLYHVVELRTMPLVGGKC